MTIKELANVTQTPIKIKDAHDGKVLCYQYEGYKHNRLDSREVLGVWAEIDVKNGGFDSFARPIICVYVAHETGGAT